MDIPTYQHANETDKNIPVIVQEINYLSKLVYPNNCHFLSITPIVFGCQQTENEGYRTGVPNRGTDQEGYRTGGVPIREECKYGVGV